MIRRHVACVFVAGCVSTTQLARVVEVADPAARRIDIEAGRRGFVPAELRARIGETITLVFRRTHEDSCLERVILHADGERQIERALPMQTPVVISLRLDRGGELGITCAKAGHTAVVFVTE